MTTLTIDPGGPTRREIVSQAYGACGIGDLEFGLTADEIVTGLRLLSDTAAQLEAEGVVIGYVQPDYGVGDAEEGAGIIAADKLGLSSALALALADEFGKQLQPNTLGRLSTNVARLRSRYASIPSMPHAAGTFAGMGVRVRYSPYLSPDDAVDASVSDPVVDATVVQQSASEDPGDLAGLLG